ncbi:lectin C-type domain protein, partial [Necator americanus]
IFRETNSWEEAKGFCETIGAYLVKIDTLEENNFLNVLQILSFDRGRTWIGLKNDEKRWDTWRWVDGTKPKFYAWKTGEPNGYRNNEWCANIEPTGGWNDLDCESRVWNENLDRKAIFFLKKKLNHTKTGSSNSDCILVGLRVRRKVLEGDHSWSPRKYPRAEVINNHQTTGRK